MSLFRSLRKSLSVLSPSSSNDSSSTSAIASSNTSTSTPTKDGSTGTANLEGDVTHGDVARAIKELNRKEGLTDSGHPRSSDSPSQSHRSRTKDSQLEQQQLRKSSSSRPRSRPKTSSSRSSKTVTISSAANDGQSNAPSSRSSSRRTKSSTRPSSTRGNQSRHRHRGQDQQNTQYEQSQFQDDYLGQDEEFEFEGGSNDDSETSDDFIGDYNFEDEHRTHSHTHHHSDFACLSPEQIIAEQKRHISEISELLMISASNASNLIRHYQWNIEKLLATYFDNPDKVVEEAGLIGATGAGEEGLRAVLSGIGECLVCCDDVEADQCCALTCEHRFCKTCWGTYLTLKIKEGEVLRINCPATSCQLAVPDDVVKEMVEQEVYEKYLRFVTKSFVEDNRHVTWCPAPGCGNAITTDQIHGQVVQCSCSYRFCFSCHSEDHRPASCEQLTAWMKKCSDESETGHWLGANTKGCPKCRVSVEKNGGCNHMTCRQCGYEWCWMCMKIWKGHADFYACERFDKTQKKKSSSSKSGSRGSKSKKSKRQRMLEQEEERENQRIALERYLEYYHKFLSFDSRVSKSSEALQKAQQRMEELQSDSCTVAETKFIEKATRILNDCYAAMRNSFVLSYFMEDENSTEKQLFLFLQSELDTTVTALANMLNSVDILKKRTEVVDLSILAQTKKDNLLSAAENRLYE